MTVKSFEQIPVTPEMRAYDIVRQAVYDWLRGCKSLAYYALRHTRTDAERRAVLALL